MMWVTLAGAFPSNRVNRPGTPRASRSLRAKWIASLQADGESGSSRRMVCAFGQPVAGLVEKPNRLGPLFKDDGTGIVALPQAFEQADYSGGIFGGRAGEKRQVTVVIAVVLVGVEMNDRELRRELIDVLQVIVARPAEQIRMPYVEAHPNLAQPDAFHAWQSGEQFVELFRSCEWGVLDW